METSGVKLELACGTAKFQIVISNRVEKSPKNPKRAKAIAKIPKISFFFQKLNQCQEVYNSPSMYQIWRIYLGLWGHDCK